MTTVEAIRLVKSKRPDEVAAEELAGLRALLEKMPSLYAALGGRIEVDRFLAEADAASRTKAIDTQIAPPPTISPAEPAPPAPRIPRRRVIELSVYAGLVVVAGLWLAYLIGGFSVFKLLRWSDQAGGPDAVADGAEKVAGQEKTGPDARGASGGTPAGASRGREEFAPGELAKEPPDIWHRWKIEATGGRAEKKFAWDLERPIWQLTTAAGRVTLKRRLELPPDAKSLRIDCIQKDAAAAGEIKMLIDGQPAGSAKVPPVGSEWPPLLALGVQGGRAVTVTLIYTPGDIQEQVVWRQIEPTSDIADVMANWGAPDAAKSSLRLWLRADLGIKDSASRRPADNGFDNLVQTWEDQSRNHFHFACDGGDASRRPLYTAHHTGIASQPAVTFDGQKQFLRLSGGPIFDGAASTTLVVCDIGKTLSLLDTAAPRYVLSVETRVGRSGKHKRQRVLGQSLSFDAPNRMTFDTSPFNGRFVIAASQIDGQRTFLELNGTGRIAGNQTGGKSGATAVLGSALAAASAPPAPPPAPPAKAPDPATLGGSLAELLIYDRALNVYELRQLGQYLQVRYGIAGGY